ncbi:hypothetical protein ACFW1F_17230 [Streptomyces bungoensis]|uniref:hypothetical protein n=1 Tax=Streptomyces bungoensis TaxID=285568 RepID=UPI00367D96EE
MEDGAGEKGKTSHTARDPDRRSQGNTPWLLTRPAHHQRQGGSDTALPPADNVAHVYGNATDHPDRVRRYPSDYDGRGVGGDPALLPVPAT